jgi:hypothetical protein
MTMKVWIAVIVAGVLASVSPIEAQAPEGIKVYGHWTTDILQLNGTLSQHHEFQNELLKARLLHLIHGGLVVLTPGGDCLLTSLLARS